MGNGYLSAPVLLRWFQPTTTVHHESALCMAGGGLTLA
jgi:hypothetical protein